MAYDEALAHRIRRHLARRNRVVAKRMFGGVAELLNGNFLVGVWRDSLIARIGPDAYDDALCEPHVREFDITRRPMRGWVVVDPAGIESDEQLNGWIARAVEFVGTLAPK